MNRCAKCGALLLPASGGGASCPCVGEELRSLRDLARKLRAYLALADLGSTNVATPEDELAYKFAALDVYNALNRAEVLMPEEPKDGK